MLESIIQRCLHMERVRRFNTGKELAAALNGWLAAYGGPVQDAEVARRLAELYPQGPSNWRADEATVATIRSEPEPERAPAPVAAPWRWLVIATVALFSLSVAMLLLMVVGLSLLLPGLQAKPGAEGLVVQAEEAEAQARRLLDAAALALAEDNLVEAAHQIEVANALVISDPDLTGLRAELDAELRFRSKLLAVRELSKVDPIAGLEQARALAAQYPDHPDLAVLLTSLEAGGIPADRPAPPTQPAPAQPSPQTRPTPPSPRPRTNDLLGARTERAPTAEPAEPVPEPTPAPKPQSQPPGDDGVLQQRQR